MRNGVKMNKRPRILLGVAVRNKSLRRRRRGWYNLLKQRKESGMRKAIFWGVAGVWMGVMGGMLGQSNPAGAEPLDGVGASDAARTGDGRIFFRCGSGVWELDGKRVAHRVDMKGVPGGRITGDGEGMWLLAGAGVHRLEIGADRKGRAKKAAGWKKGVRFDSTAVRPAGTVKGWAGEYAFFGYRKDDQSVWGYSEGKGDWEELFRAGEELAKFVSVGCEPGTGLLVLGSGYPHLKTWAFGRDGKPVLNGRWPMGGWAQTFSIAGGELWGSYGGAFLVGGEGAGRVEMAGVGDGMDMYTTAVCSDGEGGYWLATSAGLKHYPKGSARRAARRIGGMADVRCIGAANGEVLAGTGSGQVLRFWADDGGDAAPRSTGNEPWRMGGGWSDWAAGLKPMGEKWLARSGKSGGAWVFDPHARNGRWKKCGAGVEVEAAGERVEALYGGKRFRWDAAARALVREDAAAK